MKTEENKDRTQKLYEEISRLKEQIRALKLSDEKRERAEARLKESERRFRATFEQAAVGIAHVAPDGHFLRINSKFCSIVGYTCEELGEMSFQSITYPEDLKTDLECMDRLMAGRISTYSIEKRYVRKDGSIVRVNLTVSLVKGEGGQPEYMIGVVEDITERKQVEEAVRESREMLRLVMDNIPQRIFWKDIHSVYLGCNSNFARAAGVGDPGNIVGKTDYDLAWTRSEAESFRRDDREVMDNDRPKYHIIEPQLQADGTRSWLDTNKVPLHDAWGNVIGILGTYEDITARLKLEERLRLTQFSVDHFTDSSIWFSPQGDILYVNEAACRSLGYAPDELLSMHIWDIDPDYTPEKFAREMNELKVRGSITFESRHVSKDGRKFPVEVSANYITFKDREYLISFDRDITWRKRSEAELRESEESLARSQEIARLGSYAWDIPKNEIKWSDEHYRIFNCRPGEFPVSYEVFLEFVHPEDRARVNEAIARALGEHRPFDLDFRIVPRGGGVRFAHSEGQTVYDKSGTPVRMFGTIQDITDRKQVEMELEAARHQAELYLDLMSHDIGNMDQAMLGYLEMAMEMLRPEEAVKELLTPPLEIIKNSTRLINNVRKLRQLQTGEIPVRRMDLGRVLSEVTAGFSRVPGRDVRIDYRPVSGCIVEANDMLRDLFSNLIDNAIRHSEGSLRINVGIGKVTLLHREYYQVTVEDNGPGISDQLKEKLVSVIDDRTGKAERRGIGLLLVKALLEQFHGTMRIEDRVPGDYRKGSRFVILLPAVD